MKEIKKNISDNLIQIINSIGTLEPKDIEFVKSAFKEIQIKKGDFFLNIGEINSKFGFIQKGIMRYIICNNDEEITIDFAKEGEFVTEYQSFVQKSKSLTSIQALEDTTILVITFGDLQNFYNNTKNGNKIGRIIAERRFCSMSNQKNSFYSRTPEERYLYFLKTYPELVQRIAQYYIASFVGVKPQSLSRMRKRFTQ